MVVTGMDRHKAQKGSTIIDKGTESLNDPSSLVLCRYEIIDMK